MYIFVTANQMTGGTFIGNIRIMYVQIHCHSQGIREDLATSQTYVLKTFFSAQGGVLDRAVSCFRHRTGGVSQFDADQANVTLGHRMHRPHKGRVGTHVERPPATARWPCPAGLSGETPTAGAYLQRQLGARVHHARPPPI